MLPDNTGSFILALVVMFFLILFLIGILEGFSLRDIESDVFKKMLNDLDVEDEERRQHEEIHTHHSEDNNDSDIDTLINEQFDQARCYLMSDGKTVRTKEGEFLKLIITDTNES